MSPTAPGPARRGSGRRTGAAAVVLTLGLLGGLVWWAGGTAFAPAPDDVPVLTAPPAPRDTAAPSQDAVEPVLPPPTAEVAALADEAYLSEEGRALFFGAGPEILDATAFAGRCRDHGARTLPTGAVGCFDGGANSIVVYAPADPRLRGFVVETVAHETLHAAWVTLDPDTRGRLTPLLEAELARQPADGMVHEQITGSVGSSPEKRPTELFAYLGTQVWREGGLDPELEAVYARFVADRAALVAVHLAWRGVVTGMSDDIESGNRALVDRHQAHAQRRATHEGEVAAVRGYRQAYEDKRAEVAAMPAEERDRLQLSWVWWDGTDLPMAPAEQTLARAAELLARDDVALAARDAELRAEESAITTERARLDALLADYEALTAQLKAPGS